MERLLDLGHHQLNLHRCHRWQQCWDDLDQLLTGLPGGIVPGTLGHELSQDATL